MPGDSSQPSTDTSWLTLGAASRALGVAPSTLRNWVDDGRISCFRTPGGHRRFAREEVQSLLGRLSREAMTLTSRVDIQRLSLGAEHSARSLALQLPGYCGGLTSAAREHYQQSGRRLLALAIQYIVTRADRADISRRACAVGYEQGQVARAAGFSAAQTVEVFHVCTDMVQEAIVPMDPEHAPIQSTDIRRYRDLTRMIRTVLQAVLSGYEGIDIESERRSAP